jgi:hypothetical protein
VTILEDIHMKRLRYPLALTILMLALPISALAGDTAWFDLENCSMCKNMPAQEGLMEAMEWENHLTADGYMAVTLVAHGYEDKYQAAMTDMQKAGEKMMAGEKMELCGFCQSFGTLVMAGATMEYFETNAGHINLVSSHDPAVVEKIHAHAQRTIDEYAKMFGGDEHGHDHGEHGHSHH